MHMMNDKNENIDGERILPQNYQTNCSSIRGYWSRRNGRNFTTRELSNVFKFLFVSDAFMHGGHVVIDWECVEDELSTQLPETTMAASTTTSDYGTTADTTPEPLTTPAYTTPVYTTLTQPFTLPHYDKCYKHDGDSAFTNFVNAVRAGIATAIENDVESYTRRPGEITRGVRMRRDQWTRWFTKIFNKWVTDHQKAVNSGRRYCLVDRFPMSPNEPAGQLSQDSDSHEYKF